MGEHVPYGKQTGTNSSAVIYSSYIKHLATCALLKIYKENLPQSWGQDYHTKLDNIS